MRTFASIFMGCLFAGCLAPLFYNAAYKMGTWGSAIGIDFGKKLLRKKIVSTDAVIMFSAFPIALAMVFILAVSMLGVDLMVLPLLNSDKAREIYSLETVVQTINIINALGILIYGCMGIFMHIGIAKKALKEQTWDKA